MTNLNQMSGTPWHINKYMRGEGDERRHRSRCIYYNKHEKHCSKYYSTCYGASHCPYYEVEEKEQYEVKKVQSKSKEQKKSFVGIKVVPIEEVVVGRRFQTPSQKKIDEIIDYYERYGKLDKPVIVSCSGDKYLLQDKYLRYYVAKKIGLKRIPIKMNENDKLINKKAEIKCKHKIYGEGTVKLMTEKTITILFNSGKEATFNRDYIEIQGSVFIK